MVSKFLFIALFVVSSCFAQITVKFPWSTTTTTTTVTSGPPSFTNPTLVQAKECTGTGTITCTLGNSTTALDQLVVIYYEAGNGNTSYTLTDSAANIWLNPYNNNANASYVRIYYAASIVGGSDTVTMTTGAQASTDAIIVAEYSGLGAFDTATYYDNSFGYNGSINAISTTQGNDVVLASLFNQHAGSTITSVSGTNLVQRYYQSGTSPTAWLGDTGLRSNFPYDISANFNSVGGSGNNLQGDLIAFKNASTGVIFSSAVIATGSTSLGTSAIVSGTCATVVTATASGVLATDVLTYSFSSDPTGVTGYAASSAGILTIMSYPGSGNVNFKVCNNTGSSITPGAVTLNWKVSR